MSISIPFSQLERAAGEPEEASPFSLQAHFMVYSCNQAFTDTAESQIASEQQKEFSVKGAGGWEITPRASANNPV
jgi:hypothetical protein